MAKRRPKAKRAAKAPTDVHEMIKARWREVWGNESPLVLYVKRHGYPPRFPEYDGLLGRKVVANG